MNARNPLPSVLMVLLGCAGDGPPLPVPLGVGEGPTTGEGATAGEGATTGPASECGNGNVEVGEECDGAEVAGETCESQGFDGGGLACSAECTFDISGCYACGDGAVDPGEECDGAELAGETCESLGYSDGGLTCVGCQFDASACGPPPGMVDVPGGPFEMGSDHISSQQPIRMVLVDRFWMDQTEVTVAEYAACESDGACTAPATGGSCNWMVAGLEDHPVNCVTWFQAETFCGWAEGATKRLPTEAEWEKAARSEDAREYPWGDAPAPSCTHVVMNDGGSGCWMGSTAEVGSRTLGDSPYGVHDMAGNVWEWVADFWASGYDPMETDNPTGPAGGTYRVVRGGSWLDVSAYDFRAAVRGFHSQTYVSVSVGFRCARTPPAPL